MWRCSMITFSGGWAQWDYQIKTFRGEKNGVLHGKYSGEFVTAQEIADDMALTLSETELTELNNEKTQAGD